MKKITLFTACVLGFVSVGFAQTAGIWTAIQESEIKVTGIRQIVPHKFVSYALELQQLQNDLLLAPSDKLLNASQSTVLISLPAPDGSLQRFRVVESPVLAPELQAVYPNMRTYSIKGIDDVYANGKLDVTPFGLHAAVFTIEGDFFIDPYCVGNTAQYISYYTADFEKKPEHMVPEEGPIAQADALESGQQKPLHLQATSQARSAAVGCAGAQLRTYRLAIACTGEYAKAATGLTTPTKAQTLAKVVTSVNRVNGVYEKEVAIRLVLIPNDTLILFTDPATDPFNGNNNASTLIGESQTVITGTIGSANFDIGHTFSTGGGGLANLGCVCVTSSKARGITGSPSPVGDPYDIDYVAHEMGHQFGGNHTFNANTGSCNGNRNASTSVEPGSGVTIMAYAGICTSNNVAANSIAYFHGASFDEIYGYATIGVGNSCPVVSNTGNTPPQVNGVTSFAVPKSTPFSLTGSASDPDSDPITYSWEEMDPGPSGGNWNSGNAPFFRSYTPTTTATRYFPKLSVVASGNYTNTIGEFLPKSGQLLDFRLTARDNKAGGGGVCFTNLQVTVDTAGPFVVVYPSASGISWYTGSTKTIMWDPAFTDLPPVSCDSVKILISYNSGSTYSTLVESAANYGFYTIVVPTVTADITTCRIRIEAKGNTFYDIGNNNFTISLDPYVGIAEQVSTEGFSAHVYPNPATQVVNIMATLDAAQPTAVLLTDLAGRTLYTKEILQNILREQVDISGLEAGLYFVTLQNGANKTVYRLVKE